MASNLDKQSNPYDRLMTSALDLFYHRGYSGTSTNQLIADSGTHKASFYRYFQSKEEIALEYLKLQGENFENGLQRMMDRAETWEEFVHTWNSLLLKQVKSGKFIGCPIARFLNSVEEKNEDFELVAEKILHGWIQIFESYFESEKKKGNLDSSLDCHAAAKKILKLFQGSSQLFRITGKTEYLQELKGEMQEVLAGKKG
ncbi:TetR/AcrR family transcriptional regulator [Leptospira yasudae]|uniref:Transcriptional regulator n=1 Tax=Leptospira yasudae TaxID=2202201 RepID=A0A5F2AV56_9LEPT|nr:TetR/AcrR family transcriptional regulator [Leptospira yasudae]MBW0434496.1 TetR/AcrR family transcriptional regulator [Leptospira yasudae]RHX80193.1 transcriptional regulator [Leptospira yasudae]TGL76113.1 TetR/AcrR family transcriptional regulator [Leptospira yasudae]TGL79263.1 TetR/AcrR family transcriptional regulator [Leptospira yasudae]TGL82950.1 TetR/AcrR family transcriptional regulator [Leptospira yasudae]